MNNPYIEVSHDQTLRMMISMYIGKKCAHCNHEYSSVEDIKQRDPKRGYGEKVNLVCSCCWDEYDIVEVEDQ